MPPSFRHPFFPSPALIKFCIECSGILSANSELCPGCGYEFACFGPTDRALDPDTEAALGPFSIDSYKASVWARFQEEAEDKERGYVHQRAVGRYWGQFREAPPPPSAWKPATEAEKRRFYAEQIRICHERRYKIGWAFYRFKERYAESPPRELRAA